MVPAPAFPTSTAGRARRTEALLLQGEQPEVSSIAVEIQHELADIKSGFTYSKIITNKAIFIFL